MYIRRLAGCITLVVLWCAACAPQFPFITAERQSETLDLKILCEQQGIASPERKTADSLYTVAGGFLAKRKREAALALFDRAGICYRIALAKTAVAHHEKEIAKEEQALAKTREDVAAYRQVLKELKTMELR